MGLLEDAIRQYARFEDRTTDPAAPPAGQRLVYVKGGSLWHRGPSGSPVEVGAGGGGGSGGVTLLGTLDLTTAQTFTSIPGTYSDLELRVVARVSGATGWQHLHLRCNGDGGANYDHVMMRAYGSSSDHWQGFGQTWMFGGQVVGSSAPADTASRSQITFIGYAGGFLKELHFESAVRAGTGSAEYGRWHGASTWRSTAAITSLALSLPAGTFGAGSTARLYGRI
jgi:hypothetical protein